jgi:hypothetical protein
VAALSLTVIVTLPNVLMFLLNHTVHKKLLQPLHGEWGNRQYLHSEVVCPIRDSNYIPSGTAYRLNRFSLLKVLEFRLELLASILWI